MSTIEIIIVTGLILAGLIVTIVMYMVMTANHRAEKREEKLVSLRRERDAKSAKELAKQKELERHRVLMKQMDDISDDIHGSENNQIPKH